MPILAQLSGRKIIKALTKIGYYPVRQSGSHVRLHNKLDPTKGPITIPDHKTIGRGLVQKILRDAKLSNDDFIKLL